MNAETLKQIVEEIRSEFQIPPYFPDVSLQNYAKEGERYLQSLVPIIEFEQDLTARSLIKNYVYYAYFKKLNGFVENYNSNIVGWQMERCGNG